MAKSRLDQPELMGLRPDYALLHEAMDYESGHRSALTLAIRIALAWGVFVAAVVLVLLTVL